MMLQLTGVSLFSLKAYIDKDKLDQAAKQKEEAEQNEAGTNTSKAQVSGEDDDLIETIATPEPAQAKPEGGEKKANENSTDSGLSLADDKKLENGGTTVVEINHVTNEKKKASDAGSEPSRKTSVLKQEDIKISAKQQSELMTPVEAVKQAKNVIVFIQRRNLLAQIDSSKQRQDYVIENQFKSTIVS